MKHNVKSKLTSPKVLAVVPARGGSKRLPRKNIANLDGKPMLAYTILALKEAQLVTDWIVSSDDDEIIQIAQSYGADTPFVRPKELSTDKVRNIDVVLHALSYLENEKGYRYDVIILLQPTSPIRLAKHIDEAVRKIWNSDLDSLASVKGPFYKRDPILKKIDHQGNLVAYCDDDQNQREPFYIYNAALYAVKRDYFVKEKKFVSDKQIPLVMDAFCSIDVDSVEDLIVAESFLKYLKKNRIN